MFRSQATAIRGIHQPNFEFDPICQAQSSSPETS